MKLDPVIVLAGIAGSYFDPLQLMFAAIAAVLGWHEKAIAAGLLAAGYVALKLFILGPMPPHVVIAAVLFIALNYAFGWLIGRLASRRRA